MAMLYNNRKAVMIEVIKSLFSQLLAETEKQDVYAMKL